MPWPFWVHCLGGAAFSRANPFGRDKNVAPPSLAATCFRKPLYRPPYSVGSCHPLPTPAGCRLHRDDVNPAMSPACFPHHLHV